MTNNNETFDDWNESSEIHNNKKTSNFDFKTPINEFIEGSIVWNLERFDWIIGNKNWEDFIKFLKKPQNSYSHEILKSYEAGKESNYFNYLNTRILSITYPIRELKNKLLKTYGLEYTLDNWQQYSLQQQLNSQNQWYLKTLYFSQAKRRQFLSSTLHIGLEKLNEETNWLTKKDEQILQDIFNNNLNFIQQVINDKQLQDSIFTVYNMNSYIHIEHISYILDQFNDEWKKLLIQYFIPSLSLESAKNIWIVDQKYIDRELWKIGDRYWLTDTQKAEFIESIDLKYIFIDTDSIDETNILKMLNNKSYQNIANEINESKQDMKEIEILWREDFFNGCIHSQKLSQEFKNSIQQKFQVWNYINIESRDKKWGVIKYYFYIRAFTSMWVELVNITKRNWISATNQWKIDMKSFQELFTLFETVSKDHFTTITIDTKTDLVEEKKIQEIPEKNDIQNITDLKIALDNIDPKWNKIDIKDMAFQFKKWLNDNSPYDENFFFVTSWTENSIKLDSWQTFQWEQLSQFLEAFEMNKCTRFKKLDSADDFFKKISEKNDTFKDIIFHDGKIIHKDQKGNKNREWIDLFVGEKESIYIDAVENNTISFRVWEYKEWDTKKNEANTFKSDKNGKNWWYTEFYMYIKNKKLTPKQTKVNETLDDSHGDHMHQQRSLFTWWMGWLSIMEIVKWWESVISTIKHNLETWNKLKAAKAALFFWKALPKHLYVELQSEVENSEKETMEKIKKELTWVDSKVMFPMIIHILENKSAPQYEIEAAMFAVLKYGSLYPKDLAKYRGSYVWFEKLWWHKNMIPWLTENLLKDDPNLVITEEVLIQSLLWQQATWDIQPKRRSKIHKEFWATIQEWLSKEKGDGERETWLKMTKEWRIAYIMWEFKWATYANGIGWMENVWKAWPSPVWMMNTIPFVIMASWLSLEIHQSLINTLSEFAKNTPYNSLILCNSFDGVKKYNQYVERVIELHTWSKDSPMYTAFQALKKPSDKKNRAVLAKDFWDTYWAELYPVINMNDGFVISKMNEEWNENLKYYHDIIHWLLNSSDFNPKDSDIGNEFYAADNSPFAQTWALLYKIVPKDRWYLDGTSKEVMNSHMKYIHNVLQNPNVWEEGKKKIFKESYKKFERYLYTEKMDAFRDKNLPPLSWKRYNWFNVYNEMNKKWFDFYDDKVHDLDNQNEIDQFDIRYDEFLEQQYAKLKNRDVEINSEDEFIQEQHEVEKSIDEILTPSAPSI